MTIRHDLGLFVGELSPTDKRADDKRRANVERWNAILAHAAITGERFEAPPHRVEMLGTLRGRNGANADGHGNLGERADGSHLGTELVFFNEDEPAVDLQGTGESVDKRMQCTWSRMTIRHARPGANRARGILRAWNMRAEPLLDRITLKGFGDDGLLDTGPNWQTSTTLLRLDGCGTVVPGATGIGKLPEVDSGTWNDIRHMECTVEACGNASSEAGGIHLPTTTANRGLLFGGRLLLQSNFGKRQMLVTNTDAVHIPHLYAEHLLNPASLMLAEFVSCTGALEYGYAAIEALTRYGATITKGSPTIADIDTERIVEGMEVEGPYIGNTPPPRVLRVMPEQRAIMIDQPALGDWQRAEVRLRLMGTTAIKAPGMRIGALIFGTRTWEHTVA